MAEEDSPPPRPQPQANASSFQDPMADAAIRIIQNRRRNLVVPGLSQSRGFVATPVPPTPESKSMIETGQLAVEGHAPDLQVQNRQQRLEILYRDILRKIEEIKKVTEPIAGLGHNGPPSPIETFPVINFIQNINHNITIVQAQWEAVPDSVPTDVGFAARELKSTGQKILDHLKNNTAEYIAGGIITAVTALTGLTVDGLQMLANELIDLADDIIEWINILLYLT